VKIKILEKFAFGCKSPHALEEFGAPLSPAFYLHGDVEEDGEEKLVVDGHGDEARLVELRRRLAHADAQPNAPHQQHHLH
jgi:hypothetical protein